MKYFMLLYTALLGAAVLIQPPRLTGDSLVELDRLEGRLGHQIELVSSQIRDTNSYLERMQWILIASLLGNGTFQALKIGRQGGSNGSARQDT